MIDIRYKLLLLFSITENSLCNSKIHKKDMETSSSQKDREEKYEKPITIITFGAIVMIITLYLALAKRKEKIKTIEKKKKEVEENISPEPNSTGPNSKEQTVPLTKEISLKPNSTEKIEQSTEPTTGFIETTLLPVEQQQESAFQNNIQVPILVTPNTDRKKQQEPTKKNTFNATNGNNITTQISLNKKKNKPKKKSALYADMFFYNTVYVLFNELKENNRKLYNFLSEHMIELKDNPNYQLHERDDTDGRILHTVNTLIQHININYYIDPKKDRPDFSKYKIDFKGDKPHNIDEDIWNNFYKRKNDDNYLCRITGTDIFFAVSFKPQEVMDVNFIIDIFNPSSVGKEEKELSSYTFTINNHGGEGGVYDNQCGIAAFLHGITAKLFFLRYNKEQNYKYILEEQEELFLEVINHLGNVLKNQHNLISLDLISKKGDEFYQLISTAIKDLYLLLNTELSKTSKVGVQMDPVEDLLSPIISHVNNKLMENGKYNKLTIPKVGNVNFANENDPQIDNYVPLLPQCCGDIWTEPLLLISLVRRGSTAMSGHFVNEFRFVNSEECATFILNQFAEYRNFLDQQNVKRDLVEPGAGAMLSVPIIEEIE